MSTGLGELLLAIGISIVVAYISYIGVLQGAGARTSLKSRQLSAARVQAILDVSGEEDTIGGWSELDLSVITPKRLGQIQKAYDDQVEEMTGLQARVRANDQILEELSERTRRHIQHQMDAKKELDIA